jgi:hypothetical protein
MPTENRGSLRLTLVTKTGEPIGEAVEIRLRNQQLTDERVAKAVAAKPILIPNLIAIPNGLYLVEVNPTTFEPESRSVQISAEELSELCIIFRHHGEKDDDEDGHGHNQCPPLKIPDQLNEGALTSEIATRLAGTPADGTATTATAPQKVIWVDQGDEVLVHLDSVRVRFVNNTVLISVDLETDQTGRASLIVPLALSNGGDAAGLVAVTEDLPKGNGLLAARWGRQLQSSVWACLLGLAQDHGAERNGVPRGITVSDGQLSLQTGKPLVASASNKGDGDDDDDDDRKKH